MSEEQNNSPVEETEEAFNIVIRVTNDGRVGFAVNGEEAQQPDTAQLVGILEIVKMDVLMGTSTDAAEDGLVEVTLEQEDFDMDATKQLEKMGKKVGDTVILPKPIALMRDAQISEMKAQVNEKSGKPQVTILDGEGGSETVEGIPGPGLLDGNIQAES